MDHQSQPSRRLTRRGLLTAGATALVPSAAVTACGLLETDPETADGDRPPGETDGVEAPALAERVASGDLPPVEDRLPTSPLVVQPNDRAGAYGGTWRATMIGPTELTWPVRAVGYEFLLRWHQDTVAFALDEVVPSVAESFEVSGGGTEYTFHLREGMKWSDGEPFTADDLVFAVDDVILNEEIFPSPLLGIVSGGEPGRVEKIDEYTVKFIFDPPHGLFPHILASRIGGMKTLVETPRHYLEQFHPTYNQDLDQLVEEAGAPDWLELFSQKRDVWNNPELPRLHAWIPTSAANEGNGMTFERNPFYWKVDADGRQLPYLDDVVFDYVDPEVMVLRASQGEIDMQDRTVNTLRAKPVLARNQEGGDYRLIDLEPGNGNVAILFLNMTHEDPVKREIFQNMDFRIGLSHAIDRRELIKTVYQDQGEPWQTAPLQSSRYFDETLATQYLEYDPDLANEYLDRAGYSERDGNGNRLGPDGSAISFLLEFMTKDFGFEWASVGELVQTYWREVGIDIRVEAREQTMLQERERANQHDAVIGQADGGGMDPHLVPRYYFPHNLQARYGVAWAQWYMSRGSEGEEPPASVQEQMNLYDQLTTTADPAEQEELVKQILRITQEGFYSIGICYLTQRYAVVKNDFHNVPEGYLDAASYSNPGPTNPAQYFTTRP